MISGSFNFDQIKPVNPLLALFSTKNYGIEHAYRVFKLVDRIFDFEKIDECNRNSLKFCALFIGIGREEKSMNLNYAAKSYEKLVDRNFLGKAIFHTELTRFLFQSHLKLSNEIGNYQIEKKKEAILLHRILKDALCLDAFRLGNFCAADLELSNSKKLVLFASQFYRKELKQDLILKEIENWLKEIQ